MENLIYKKSKYNVIIDKLENGNKLIYNTLKNTYGIMNIETQKIYDNIENFQEKDIETIKENGNFKDLVKYGYIISYEDDELMYIKFDSQYQKFKSKQCNLTIAPTLDCNMACPYCYEDKKAICMDERVQIVLYDFVKELLEYNNYKVLHVSWYGGEPLLELNIIKKISKSLIELCKKLDVEYSASIVTNGVLLDLETANILKNDCCVNRAQVTIDGLPEYHNKRRILKNGENSFDIICKNIELCKEIITIGIRINVDTNNMNNIHNLCDYFMSEKKWTDKVFFYLAPVENYTDSCYFSNTNCLSDDEFAQLDLNMIEALYQLNPDIIRNGLYPLRKSNYCSAVTYGSYVIDPEGYLYTCWNVVGKKDKAIGNIIDKNIISNEYLKWLTYEPDKKCEECSVFPICGGGCPFEYFRRGKPFCEKKIINYKEKLKIAYRDYERCKKTNGISY